MAKPLDEILNDRAVEKRMEYAKQHNAKDYIYWMIATVNPGKRVKKEEAEGIITYMCKHTQIFEEN